MKYEIKNYNHLQNIGEISNDAMNMHFKLYEGYVKNTNALVAKMTQWRDTLTGKQYQQTPAALLTLASDRVLWNTSGVGSTQSFD